MTIITYLGGKYAASKHTINLAGAATNVHFTACKEAAYMQTPLNKATAYYNFIHTNYFHLE